jgi:hypothetical protein
VLEDWRGLLILDCLKNEVAFSKFYSFVEKLGPDYLWCLGTTCLQKLELDALMVRVEVVRQGFGDLVKR